MWAGGSCKDRAGKAMPGCPVRRPGCTSHWAVLTRWRGKGGLGGQWPYPNASSRGSKHRQAAELRRCKDPGQIPYPSPAAEQGGCPPLHLRWDTPGRQTHAAASHPSTHKHYAFLKGASCEGLDTQRNCAWIEGPKPRFCLTGSPG